MFRKLFHIRSIRICTFFQSLHIFGGGACAVEHREWAQTNKPAFTTSAIVAVVRKSTGTRSIPVQFVKQQKFGAVPEHRALGVDKDQACHAVVDIRPIARGEVAAACKGGAAVDRHAASLALVDTPSMGDTLG